MRLLLAAGRHARFVLAAGLAVGILFPQLGAVLRPWLPEMIFALLFLAAIQVDPGEMVGARGKLPRLVGLVLALQVALPLALAGAAWSLGVLGHPLTLSVILMAAAPSITASPHIAAMMGKGPAPAMRLLIAGTALLPLTVIPVFAAVPELRAAGDVTTVVLKLLAAIAVSVAASLVLHRMLPKQLERARQALEGTSAILLAVAVVGLVAFVTPALLESPPRLLAALGVAAGVNFSLQVGAYLLGRRLGMGGGAVPIAVVAGNRNIALFLLSLSPAIGDKILLFIGCYQIPMYLTPLIFHRLYRRP